MSEHFIVNRRVINDENHAGIHEFDCIYELRNFSIVTPDQLYYLTDHVVKIFDEIIEDVSSRANDNDFIAMIFRFPLSENDDQAAFYRFGKKGNIKASGLADDIFKALQSANSIKLGTFLTCRVLLTRT